MRKFRLFLIILFSIVFISACSLSRQINPYDLPAHNLSRYKTVGVKKRNGEYIKFKDGYLVENSFSGTMKDGKEMKIPINEIDHINLNEEKSGKTVAIIAGIFFLVVPVAIAIAME